MKLKSKGFLASSLSTYFSTLYTLSLYFISSGDYNIPIAFLKRHGDNKINKSSAHDMIRSQMIKSALPFMSK